MKQFFEQYGGVALGILALLVLIAMITPVGNLVKTSLQGTVHKFSSSMNSQTDDMTNQMTNIMNSAGDFLNIKSDGKMYKGDVLYTGWDGDKAYLEGVENPVRTNLCLGTYWSYNGFYGLRTDQEFINAGLNPNDFEIVSFKIDDKIIYEHSRGESFDGLKASVGVSTFETMVRIPSNFLVSISNYAQARNLKKEIISDNNSIKIIKFSGIIDSLTGDYDIGLDDLYISGSY